MVPAASSAAPAVTTPSCTATDPNVAVPNGPHGLFIVPNNSPTSTDATTVYNQPELCGATVQVNWANAQPTSAASSAWTTSTYDVILLQQWAQALGPNRVINLVVTAAGETPAQGAQVATPSWLQTKLNAQSPKGIIPISSCPAEAEPTPVLFDATFANAWKAFIKTTLTDIPLLRADGINVGYVRFGLGTGGEGDIANITNSTCGAAWEAAAKAFTKFTDQSYATAYQQAFANYVGGTPALDYLKKGTVDPASKYTYTTTGLIGSIAQDYQGLVSAGKNPPQLEEPINNLDYLPSPYVAAPELAKWGIGIGNQGLNLVAVNLAPGNPPACKPLAWCKIFENDINPGFPVGAGNANVTVPIYTQTGEQTCAPPAGSNNDGSGGDLGTLLPFAQTVGVQAMEVVQADWDAAFNPQSIKGTYTGNCSGSTVGGVASTADYQCALYTAAVTLGSNGALTKPTGC